MADAQHAALSKMIVEGDLRQFVEAKITAEFFPDETWKKVYIYLLGHWRKYSTPPTPDVVARSFPTTRRMWEMSGDSGLADALAKSARTAPDVINVSRGVLYANDELSFAERAKFWEDA